MTTAMNDRASEFVQFALDLYSVPGVKEICLRAQDAGALNVNCLLLAAWTARIGLSLDAGAWNELQRRTKPLRERAVAPMRELRRRISSGGGLDEALRDELKRHLLSAELIAERAEECTLAEGALELAEPAEPGTDLLAANLRSYAPESAEASAFAAKVGESGMTGV